MHTFFSILVILFMIAVIAVGFAGTIVPMLAGIPIIYLAIFLYGWFEGFEHVNAGYLMILGVLTVLSVVIDQLCVIFGMKVFDSDNRAILGSVVGSIIGLFVLPPFGVVIFCFLGAFAVEYYLWHNLSLAIRSSIGAVLGFLSGTLFKVLLGVGFMVSFIVVLL